MKSKNNKKIKNLVNRSKKNKLNNYKRGGFFFSNYRINNETFNNSSIEKLYLEYKTFIIELILNSKFKLLSDTSLYGLIFLGEIQNSQYYFKDSQGNEIKKYIIKGSFISNNNKTIEVLYNNGGKEFASVSLKDFEKEIKTQKEVYIKSLETYYAPIVPDIQLIPTSIKLTTNEIYNSNIQEIPIKHFLNNMIFTDEIEKEKVNQYFNKIDNININFHIFIMQYIENYYPISYIHKQLSTIIRNNKLNIQELLLLKENKDNHINHNEINTQIQTKLNENWLYIDLIKNVKLIYVTYHILLGLLGYIHGDAHGGNIMIYFDINDPNNSLNEFKAYIIDFGFIQYDINLSYNIINNYNSNYNEVVDKISKIINKISNFCDIPRKSYGTSKEEWGCYNIFNYNLYNNFNYFIKIMNILSHKIETFIKYKDIILQNPELNKLYIEDIKKYKEISNYKKVSKYNIIPFRKNRIL